VTPEQHLLRWEELHGVTASPLVRRWLRLVQLLARPLAAARVPPDLLTAAALAATALALAVPHGWVLVLLAGLLDGLDGAVAVLADRVSARGALLDRVADRLGEVLFAVLLVRAGAPWGLGLACGAGMLGLEAMRRGGVGRVTVAERPVRVLFTAAGLATWPGLWTSALLGLSLVGIGQLAQAGPSSSLTMRADSATNGRPPPGCAEPPTR
jgi:CDP-diacylglycerol--glycerol-3-phosphate 3-phosphatidyltransferase